MTDTPHLASLRRKLKARESKAEYKDSVVKIREEIARLEQQRDGYDL